MPVLGGYEHCGAIEQYRAATQRLSKLAGVTQPSFRCRKCGKSQVVNGRNRSLSGVLFPPAPTRNNASHVHEGGTRSDQGDSDQQQVAAA